MSKRRSASSQRASFAAWALALSVALGISPGCQDKPPAPAPVGAAAQALNLQQVQGLVNIFDHTTGLGLPEEIEILRDWMKHTKKILEMLDNFQRCVTQGNDLQGCAAQRVVWPGFCYLAANLYEDAVPWIGILGLPLEEACLGEPVLKCCKYTPTEYGCHSAFNTSAPINCEGNPTTPLAQSFGPCLAPPNGIGCLCDYLPQCDVDGDGSQSSVGTNSADAWRFNTFTTKLAQAFLPLLGSAPMGASTFVTFFGCRGHAAAMNTFAPFTKQDSIAAGLSVGSAYHTDDADPDARYLRALMTLAVRRVITAVPNIIARWNHIAVRSWTQADIDAYLGGVDADAVLGAQLGPFGLQLLQSAEPTLYRLLAIPLPGEVPDPSVAGWVGGCAPGAPPDLGITVNVVGATVSLTLSINDPLAADNLAGVYLVGVDWGDGRVIGYPFVASDPSTHVVTHAYASPGTYTIYAVAPNTSGLRDTESTTVTIAADGGAPGARSVDSVDIDLLGTVTATSHGILYVDAFAIDSADRTHSLGRYWAKPAGASGSTVTIDLSQGPLTLFEHTDVKSLLIQPAHVSSSGVSFRELTLGTVTVNHHASEGMPASSVTYYPTNQDVQILATGATVPVAPLLDLATGRLRLPAQSANIRIDLVSAAPDPNAAFGCRPVYGVTTPLMVTAEGGCHDPSTGLTWSLISTSKMTWHDAVWDSALTGNASSDATDYSRVNDYPQQYPLTAFPDASTVNYCHELTQAGYGDWRLPTEIELLTVMGTKASSYFAFDANYTSWTSTTWFGSNGGALAMARTLTGGSLSTSYGDKATVSYRALCVREAPPPPQAVCKVPAGGGTVFVTGSGGCKDTRTGGLVWSRATVVPLTWHQTIWGSELAGNAPPDANDGGKRNDYAGNAVPTPPDASLQNYCHSLVEGSFSDWRVPTASELIAVRGATLAGAYFPYDVNDRFWSSNTFTGYAETYTLSGGGTSYTTKTSLARAVCVRAPTAGDCADADADGICNPVDNCPGVANPTQADADADGTGDACEL